MNHDLYLEQNLVNGLFFISKEFERHYCAWYLAEDWEEVVKIKQGAMHKSD